MTDPSRPTPATSAALPDLAGAEEARRRSAGTAPPGSRRGELVARIVVGLALVLALVVSLAVVKTGFLVLAALGVALSVVEVGHALAVRGIRVPLAPAVVGSLGMLVSAYVVGTEGLLIALGLTLATIVVWRVVEDRGMGAIRDVAGGAMAIAWIGFLASFLALMLARPDGDLRVFAALLLPVANDTGGYVVGRLFGRHKMAPSISPGKTWEGFAGSLLFGIAFAYLGGTLLLGGPWWACFVLGPPVVLVASIGDLCESLLKRDLGLKDMGHLLPGHGGVLDRLDSILLTSPFSFLLLGVLVP